MPNAPEFAEYVRCTAPPGQLAPWLTSYAEASSAPSASASFTVAFGGPDDLLLLRPVGDLREVARRPDAAPEVAHALRSGVALRQYNKLLKAVPFSPALPVNGDFVRDWSEDDGGFVIEQRTFDFKPGRMRPWIAAYRDLALPVHRRLLGQFLYMGTTEAGDLNQVIYLWAYRDLHDREERRAAVEADAGWAEFAKETKAMQAYRKQSSLLLHPTRFSSIR